MNREQLIQQSYTRLDALYTTDNAYERVVAMRQLLEVAYRFANDPTQPIRLKPASTDDNLFSAMSDYYANHEGSYKFTAHEVRRRLNDYIHDLSLNLYGISTHEMIDLLNKVRKIMDILYGCDTKPKKGAYQMALSDTNEEQDNAVNSEARASLVIAGPGTGKTHLIVDRIVHSLRQTDGRRIVGLAFTNAAARHLQARFDYKVFGTTDFESSSNLEIGTLHSFALNMLRRYYESKDEVFAYDVIDEMERMKIEQRFQHKKELVEAYIEEHRLLTFDMITDKCLADLQDDEFARFIAQQTFEIVIDEAQDLSRKDCNILKKIFDASDSLRIFVVGDQRQNIYGFRDGSMKNFIDVGFKAQYFKLSRSYRCPDTVLKFVNTLTFTDCKNPPLYNPQNPGEPLCCYRLLNEQAERDFIVQRIAESVAEGHSCYADHAILISSSYGFDPFAQAFNDAGIPFKTFGGQPVLKQEVQAFIYLLGAIEQKKYALQQFFLSMPFDAFAEGVVAHETFKQNVERISRVEHARPFVSLIEEYISKKEEHHNDCKTMPLELVHPFFPVKELSADYIRLMELGGKSAQTLTDFVAKVADLKINSYVNLKIKLSPYQAEFYDFYDRPSVKSDHLEEQSNDFVTLSTIHSAKGKEWNYVYVPSLTYDLFPSYKSLRNGQLNDETKKFYVACTRTKKVLCLTSPTNYVVRYAGGSFDKANQSPSIYVKSLDIVPV